MNRCEKIPAVLMAAGLLSIALPQVAKASDIDDLSAKVQQLSAQVDQLKKQQDAAPKPAVTPLSAVILGTTFTLYGDIDIYANHMTSDSGRTINALEDGGIMRSRWGIKGEKPVGDGYAMKFNVEGGFNALNGKQADTAGASSTSTSTLAGTTVTTTTATTAYSGRLFDRCAWMGLSTPIGEFRVGRQNTTIQQLGGEIDFAARNIGGVINLFGVPSRYDSDLSFLSKRFYGFSFQAHYSLAGTAVTNSVNGNIANIGNQKVWQVMGDYKKGPYSIGYMEIVAAPPAGGTGATPPKYGTSVVYINPYMNYNYGKGKIYLAGVHTNNNGANGALFNTGAPLSNTGATLTGTLNAGTNSELNTYYNIGQVSVDYVFSPRFKVGGLYGVIRDITNHAKNAHGYAAGAFYDVFKDTHTYAMYDVIHNDRGAGFTQAGSAGLSPNFSAASDVNGRKITGVQVGVMYNF